MKIIVIGGNGFIGSHFVGDAVDRGHQVVVCEFAPNKPRYAHGRPYTQLIGGIRALIDDFASYEDADVICHFASSTIPSTSNLDPIKDIEDNLIQGIRLLDVMKHSRCKRIVYLSSGGAIYGPPRHVPIEEEHPQHPLSSYGIVKGAMERYLELYAGEFGLRPAVVRPSNPFGPGQNASGQLGVISAFLNCARHNTPVTLFGDGSTIRDFIYISDLTDMLLKIIAQDAVGVFNCGRGEGVSLNELIDVICGVTGRSLRLHREAARHFDPNAVVLDISRARRDLGWAPATTLTEGIRRTWESMADAEEVGN